MSVVSRLIRTVSIPWARSSSCLEMRSPACSNKVAPQPTPHSDRIIPEDAAKSSSVAKHSGQSHHSLVTVRSESFANMADFANMKTWPDRLAHTSLRNFTAENDHFWLEQSPANKTKWAQVRAQSVLVQREMESGRSPLASIARASAGRVARPNATATGMRKQRAETATGFKKKIHIGWSALTQPAWVEETNWLGKKMVTARTLILTARGLPWGNLPRWRFFVNDTVFGSESAHFSPTATLRPSWITSRLPKIFSPNHHL